MDALKNLIREVPDFPKPGINFYDITTLLKDQKGLQSVLDALKSRYAGANIDTSRVSRLVRSLTFGLAHSQTFRFGIGWRSQILNRL